MDEIEKRIAALETAFFEVLAWIDPAALDDAKRSIEAGLAANVDADEHDVRRGALHLINDAQQRFAGLMTG